MSPLPGVCSDVKAMQALLLDRNARQDRIIVLRNEAATRENILQLLMNLSTNPAIEKDDPILFYFAGHGTKAPSADDPTNDIEMICPYDFIPNDSKDKVVQGIADVTLAVHLNQISEAKGNNITVILDCCHSGSGTREPGHRVRGFKLASGYHCHAPAQGATPENPIISSEPKMLGKNYATWGSASHVLLAACSAEQPSNETHKGGVFTGLLIEALRGHGAHNLTYKRLVEDLPEAEHQQPQCEGVYTDRYLFTSISATPEHDFHKLKRQSDTYCVKFGDRFKAKIGDQYDIVHDVQEDGNRPFFGRFTVKSTFESTAELVPFIKKTSGSTFSPPKFPLFLSLPKREGLGPKPQRIPANVLPLWTNVIYQLAAGEAYGITSDSKFSVHIKRDAKSPLTIGRDTESPFRVTEFAIRSITNFTAEIVATVPITNAIDFPATAYGLQTQTGKNLEFAMPKNLSFITDRLKDGRLLGKHQNIPVTILTPAPPRVTLVMEEENTVAFEVNDDICHRFGVTRLCGTVRCDNKTNLNEDAEIITVLSGAADFFRHIHRAPKISQLCLPEKVFLRCYELEEGMVDGGWAMKKKDPANDLIEGDMIQLTDDGEHRPLGFEIINNTRFPLYAALFYFDMGDLSIESYYEPGAARDGKVDRSIRPHTSLTIGYGAGGGIPRMYHVREGRHVDVGFLKLFVSTQWVDYSHIKQNSPFDGTARLSVNFVPMNTPWDSMLVPIVQERDME